MKAKHLVLDPDVYLKLKRRKRDTGSSAQDVGNAILRSVLSRPLLTDVIGKELVEMGKLSSDEYDRLLARATKKAQGMANLFDDLIHVTARKTISIGGWEAQEVFRPPDGAFQVLVAWVADGNRAPTTSHFHDQHEFILVVDGTVEVETEAEEHILKAQDSVSIPPGRLHNTIPLTEDARVIVVNTPPWPDYVKDAQQKPEE